jgi:GntR family transcriptional regulator
MAMSTPIPKRLVVGPLYRQVQHTITTALAQGLYPPGTSLPSEHDLAAQCKVSVGTLRKAVDALVADGILVRHQGRGTFVATHDRDRLRFYFFHVVRHEGEKDAYPEVGFIFFREDRADVAAARKLQIEPGAPVFRMRNRLSMGGGPVVVDDVTLAASRFPGLTENQVLSRSGTLYHLYQSAFGITVVRSSERLRAVATSVEHARLLNLNPGAPALEIRRIARAYDDSPVEWRVSTVNTAGYEYASELGT